MTALRNRPPSAVAAETGRARGREHRLVMRFPSRLRGIPSSDAPFSKRLLRKTTAATTRHPTRPVALFRGSGRKRPSSVRSVLNADGESAVTAVADVRCQKGRCWAASWLSHGWVWVPHDRDCPPEFLVVGFAEILVVADSLLILIQLWGRKQVAPLPRAGALTGLHSPDLRGPGKARENWRRMMRGPTSPAPRARSFSGFEG